MGVPGHAGKPAVVVRKIPDWVWILFMGVGMLASWKRAQAEDAAEARMFRALEAIEARLARIGT